MRFDYLVFIGRFEPFHNGHQAVIARALSLAREVIVLVGSANTPRSIRNPWNVTEREVMIRATFPQDASRLQIRPLRDHLYNDAAWINEVQHVVAGCVRDAQASKIGLIGHRKDLSSYYLEMFPQWEFVNVPNVAGVSASDLRDYLFDNDLRDEGKDLLIQAAVPSPVFAMLKGFRDGPQFAQLVREFRFIREYRRQWAVATYSPKFVTVDAVLIHSGHVLLVRRRAEPGKGLWALPGGFIEAAETLEAAVLRELHEETRVALSDSALRAALKDRAVFDHPERSLRGRTITHAFHFEFPKGELPHITAADDAEFARWVPLGDALEMQEQFYEDHFHILERFLGRA